MIRFLWFVHIRENSLALYYTLLLYPLSILDDSENDVFTGEYAAIGVDVEKYEPDEAIRYLAGPLRNEPGPKVPRAFRSYLAVAPSPAPSYPSFAREVNRRLQLPPFSFTNPLLALGGDKVVSVINYLLKYI